MLLTLQRRPTEKGATHGELFIDGVIECWTLEDPLREDPNKQTPENEAKVAGNTCIPAGKYRVVLTKSNRFKKVLPELLKVPGFTGVRIHAGNGPEHTEGCILVGQSATDGRIHGSKDAMVELMAAISSALDVGEQVWIEIKNPEGM